MDGEDAACECTGSMILVIQPVLLMALVNEHLQDIYGNPFTLLYLLSTYCVPGSLLQQIQTRMRWGCRPAEAHSLISSRVSDVSKQVCASKLP